MIHNVNYFLYYLKNKTLLSYLILPKYYNINYYTFIITIYLLIIYVLYIF